MNSPTTERVEVPPGISRDDDDDTRIVGSRFEGVLVFRDALVASKTAEEDVHRNHKPQVRWFRTSSDGAAACNMTSIGNKRKQQQHPTAEAAALLLVNGGAKMECIVEEDEDEEDNEDGDSDGDRSNPDPPPVVHDVNPNAAVSMEQDVDETSTTTCDNGTNSSSGRRSPMTLLNLGESIVQSRRSSMATKTALDSSLLFPATSSSSSSLGRRRFPLRQSDKARTSARLSHATTLSWEQQQQPQPSWSTVGSTEEEADTLGYDAEEPPTHHRPQPPRSNAGCGAGADEPPRKRFCRYQRRNSFVIPETSRSKGQEPTFSWKAMNFLYGRSPSTTMSINHHHQGLERTSEEMLRRLSLPTLDVNNVDPPLVSAAAAAAAESSAL